MDYNQIMSDLKKGNYQPIYFLYGEEPFFIDKITGYIIDNVLKEEEKAFNQSILYGKDVNISDLITLARRFPMMAGHQVVVVKEAQEIKNLENLELYVKNPLKSTILVINYKYKKLDKRTRLAKLLPQQGVFFESKKPYDNQVPDWIINQLKAKGYEIDFKASALLNEYLGNDLTKINHELDKLIITLPAGSNKITPAHIEKNIGISKDYNNFELLNALAEKDKKKAYQIIDYFGKNQKNHPFVLTIFTLYNFFSKTLAMHSIKDHSTQNLAKELNVKPFATKNFLTAYKKYPTKKLMFIIHALREYDVRSKGLNNPSTGPDELLKELIYIILN
mgnify:FL=1